MSNTLISGYNGTFEVGTEQVLDWLADNAIWSCDPICGSVSDGSVLLVSMSWDDSYNAPSYVKVMDSLRDALYCAEVMAYDPRCIVEVWSVKDRLGVEFLQLGDFHGGREVLVHLSWRGHTFAAIVTSWGDVDLVTDWQGSQPRTLDECKDYVWAILYDWEPVDGLTTDMVLGAVYPAFAGDVDFGCERAAASC